MLPNKLGISLKPSILQRISKRTSNSTQNPNSSPTKDSNNNNSNNNSTTTGGGEADEKYVPVNTYTNNTGWSSSSPLNPQGSKFQRQQSPKSLLRNRKSNYTTPSDNINDYTQEGSDGYYYHSNLRGLRDEVQEMIQEQQELKEDGQDVGGINDKQFQEQQKLQKQDHVQNSTSNKPNQRKKKWRKLLYIKQDYSDSHVDDTFLMQLQKNVNVQIYDYWEVVMQSTAITQHISSILVFVSIFIYLFRQELSSVTLQWWSGLSTILGCFMWDSINVYLETFERRVFRLKMLKGAVFFVLLLLGLSPILRTLTSDTSSDTIWALSVLCFCVNLAFHDYSSSNLTNIRFPGSISLNAAVFAAVLLASRLENDGDVWAFLIFALEWFGLFPISRRYLKGISSKATVLITAFLATLAACLFYPIAKVITVVQIFGTLFITFICPIWLIWVQRYKNKIHGPWDEAQPIVHGY